MEYADQFARLFQGNPRSYGVWFAATGKVKTVRGSTPPELYDGHLAGVEGLGQVPVLDDGTCWFGAIDIDAHGDLPDIDLVALEADVRRNHMPLMVCRSKSGGAHLYVFGADPVPAKVLRKAMSKWATTLGYPSAEIFPKQSELIRDSDGERQLGNWINLCYFNAESPDCNRYAVEGGRRITVDYFIELAESRRVTAATLVEKTSDGHEEAPPCLQKIIAEGVGRGQRNEALYNVVVYLKKAFPETWKDRAFDLNARIFSEPLAHSEASKTITSAGRRDYRYRCKEEPCRSRCKSHVCVTRKFGITPEEKGELELGGMPEFGPVEKHNSDPPKWVLYVDSTPVEMSSAVMSDYRQMRLRVMEKINRVLPMMKGDQWDMVLNDLLQKVVIYETPEDASARGLIQLRLQDFFQRTDLTSSGEDKSERDQLLLGSPVVQLDPHGNRRVYFRGSDFTDFLRKNRIEDLKGAALWMALREHGVEHTRLRVGSKVIQVWHAPIEDSDPIPLPEIVVEM